MKYLIFIFGLIIILISNFMICPGLNIDFKNINMKIIKAKINISINLIWDFRPGQNFISSSSALQKDIT